MRFKSTRPKVNFKPGLYFSGISGKLEMSANLAKVREKAQRKGKGL